ncbi:MAG: Verru_Chthon cassette protein B [Verrucomicrobiota bacterium]
MNFENKPTTGTVDSRNPADASEPFQASDQAFSTLSRARRGRRQSDAFTLIEVTIALGICATVLIALLGLLPGSLDTMRDAVEITTEARITEELVSEIQLADWDEIVNFENEERYYDDQGTDITKDISSGGNALRHMYTARINVSNDAGIRMPGDEEDNEFTRKLTIDIAATRGRGFPADRRQFNSYSTIISRMNELRQP